MDLIDFLYPKKCLGCKTAGKYLCDSCLRKAKSPAPTCPICDKASIDGVTHIKCQKPLGLNGLYSIFSYRGVIRKTIINLKYKFARDVLTELILVSTKILEKNSFLFSKSQTLTPIPLYWYKENFRGFNQSSELGRSLSEAFGWGFTPDLIVKKKLNKPQAGLNRNERKNNVEDVFSLNPGKKGLPADCILFDDVYTTGFTMREVCKLLKRRGVNKVWGLTIAR